MSDIQDKEGDEKLNADELRSIYDEPFYFESDVLALRTNPDYSCLLKTLVLLEAQRIKAYEDLTKLVELKEKALNDPTKFLNNLKENVKQKNEFDFPNRQSIFLLPDIDWNKYYDYVDLNSEEMRKSESLLEKFQSLRRAKRATANSTVQEPVRETRQLRTQNAEKVISYNKSWDEQEQRRLEDLLLEFPPEDNEAARWRKIATKLGSRTPLQVQSHCQKYFIKLAKAGLPVPGRMPNLKTYITKKGSRGCRKGPAMISSRGGIQGSQFKKQIVGRGVSLNEISSMWKSFNPPITMNDDQDMGDDDDDDDYDDLLDNDYEDDEQHQTNENDNSYYNQDNANDGDENSYVNSSDNLIQNIKTEPFQTSESETYNYG